MHGTLQPHDQKAGKSDILNVHCDPFLTKLAFLSFMLSTDTIIP